MQAIQTPGPVECAWFQWLVPSESPLTHTPWICNTWGISTRVNGKHRTSMHVWENSRNSFLVSVARSENFRRFPSSDGWIPGWPSWTTNSLCLCTKRAPRSVITGHYSWEYLGVRQWKCTGSRVVVFYLYLLWWLSAKGESYMSSSSLKLMLNVAMTQID